MKHFLETVRFQVRAFQPIIMKTTIGPTKHITVSEKFFIWLYGMTTDVNADGYVNFDCLSKNHIVCAKTEFNFIAMVYRHTHYLSIPSVWSVRC